MPVLRKIDKSNFKAKSSNLQHAVDFQDSSQYEDDVDLNAISVHAIGNQESREVFVPVVSYSEDSGTTPCKITGKVDTGAMVSCMSLSILFHSSDSVRKTSSLAMLSSEVCPEQIFKTLVLLI